MTRWWKWAWGTDTPKAGVEAKTGSTTASPAKVEAPPSPEPKTDSDGIRRIYVLHSGMIDTDNTAALHLQAGLVARGIPKENTVILNNPYPQETWPGEANFSVFRNSAKPDSAVAKTAYENYQTQLTALGATPKDQIIWVGHSAGGQMGMTVSKLAAEAQDENGNKTGIPVHTLITLGTPTAQNNAPSAVQLRHYQSGDDQWVNPKETDYLSRKIGVPIQVHPGHFDGNDRMRLFPYVRHEEWYQNPFVLDRLVTENNPAKPDRITRLTNSPSWGEKLLGRMDQAVETHLYFSYDSVPKPPSLSDRLRAMVK